MPYTIHFVGLVCLIDQNPKDGYLAALPHALKPPDLRDDHQGEYLEPHYPFLIAVLEDIELTENWPVAFIKDKAAFLAIDEDAELSFEFADGSGSVDETQLKADGYLWSVINPKFQIKDRTKPKNAIARAKLTNGTFRVRRFKSNAQVVHFDVPVPPATTAIKITLKGAATRELTIKNDSEIILANVSEDRLLSKPNPGNDTDHFYIYYVMDESGLPPGGKAPRPNEKVKLVMSHHPFLDDGRDIDVACSPLTF